MSVKNILIIFDIFTEARVLVLINKFLLLNNYVNALFVASGDIGMSY